MFASIDLVSASSCATAIVQLTISAPTSIDLYNFIVFILTFGLSTVDKVVSLILRCKNTRKVAFKLIFILNSLTSSNMKPLNSLIFSSLLFLFSCTGIKDLNHVLDGTVINFSKKGLTEIPEEVFMNKSLKVLKLYGNKLETLPDEIGDLENLEKLYLGKNNIKRLPASIGKLKKLKILSAQYNLIDSLPDSIGELENLEQLILNQNKLTSLPKSIGNLKKLVVLQLKFNELEDLPVEIGNCENLQFIHLNRNYLTALPKELSNLRKLRELYLSGAGPLLDVPEGLCGLRYFELLEIDGTILVPPCLIVRKTTNLRIIVN